MVKSELFSDFEIRKLARKLEAEACAQIMATSEPWITLKRAYRECLEIIVNPRREVYIAVVNREVLGFIILQMEGTFTRYIQTVAVKVEWRSRGIGSRLIAFAEKRILAERPNVLWTLDAERMIGVNQHGHKIALRPFMGVMGMPPDAPGIHSTIPPRFCGGNIDCKELVAGSVLYLPISVPEALFSVGDGHATQAYGEVCTTAIECPMERVELTFVLHDDLHLTTPRANTPIDCISLGFHENLHEATMIALEAMVDLLAEQYRLPRLDALAMASLVVDLRITQIVNGVCGVHAVLPHGAIQ